MPIYLLHFVGSFLPVDSQYVEKLQTYNYKHGRQNTDPETFALK